MVILVGVLDNNKTRKLCHDYFMQTKDLIYIDAGNGTCTGQVICGIKRNHKVVWDPAGTIYPDLLEGEKYPDQLSCSERSISEPQTIAANVFAAAIVFSILQNILIEGETVVEMSSFSSRLCNMKPTIEKEGEQENEKSTNV